MFCYPFNQSAVRELVMLTKPASMCCPTSISWSTWFLPTSQDQMEPVVFVISEVVTFRNGAMTSLGCTTDDYTISEKLICRCDTEKSQGQSLYHQTIIFKIWPLELFDSHNVPLLGVFEFVRNLRSIDCSTLFSLQCPPYPLIGFLLSLRWLDLSASVTTGLYLNLLIVTACHKFHFFYTPFFSFPSQV